MFKKRRKNTIMMLLKSFAIIVIMKATMQILSWSQKTSVGLGTSIPMINDNKKEVMLKKVSYIKYLVNFWDKQVKAFLNSNNKVNVISLAYIRKLGFKFKKLILKLKKLIAPL